jgi:RNA polymerase sigma-70 factor (ECF subfamily)
MDPATATDVGQLITAARGDADGLGRLLERYRSYLTLLARVQIGQRLQGKVDPADLVQETYLEAHRYFDRFQGETEPVLLAWLRRILASQTARLVRRYGCTQARDLDLERTLERELDSSSGLLDRGLVDRGESPSGAAARREQAVLLADALDRLPSDYREVIILRQLEGLAFDEVAGRMGRTVDAVQKLWVRGLDQLRRLVEGQA